MPFARDLQVCRLGGTETVLALMAMGTGPPTPTPRAGVSALAEPGARLLETRAHRKV